MSAVNEENDSTEGGQQEGKEVGYGLSTLGGWGGTTIGSGGWRC